MKKPKPVYSTLKEIPSIAFQALESMQKAVDEAVKEHKRLKIPLHVWKDGKSVTLKPWLTKSKS